MATNTESIKCYYLTTHDTKSSFTNCQWLSWSRNCLFMWRYAKQLVTEPFYGTLQPKLHLYILLWSYIKPSSTSSRSFPKYVHSGNNFKLCFPHSDRSKRSRTLHIQTICTKHRYTVSHKCYLLQPPSPRNREHYGFQYFGHDKTDFRLRVTAYHLGRVDFKASHTMALTATFSHRDTDVHIMTCSVLFVGLCACPTALLHCW